jgi:hypothetical protein
MRQRMNAARDERGTEEGVVTEHDQQPVHLEDAGTPEAKYGAHGDQSAEEEIRGEWQRAGEMQQESEHLREVLNEARAAVQKAEEAGSLASGGMGVRPEDVQDEGSGRADEEQRRS